MTQRNGWAWCALAAVLFGAATPATKLVVDHVGAVTLARLLYLGAAVAVAPFAFHEQRSTASLRQRSLLLIAVALGGGLAPVLLVLALAPFIGALLASSVNGDRLTSTTVVAFTVSLVGVTVVATSDLRNAAPPHQYPARAPTSSRHPPPPRPLTERPVW